MQTEKIATQIRDYFHNSTIKKTNVFSRREHGDWNQFCVALDTIADTCFAIENFKKNSEDLFIKNSYLIVYGVLQALYIQQDAVNFLKKALFGNDNNIDWNSKKYSELDKIRQVRNETVGHPVKKGEKNKKSKYIDDEITSCTIDRSTLTKDGLRYTLWMYSKTESKTIKFSEIIDLQDKYLSAELELIMKKMQKEEKQHKKNFKGEKLADYLNKESLYNVSLIYGFQSNDHLAWPSFDYHYTQYKKVRKGLEARYGKMENTLRIPGTEMVIKKLDYIFSKIESLKNTGKFDNYELEIYIDALDTGLNELKTHLMEVDKEFEV